MFEIACIFSVPPEAAAVISGAPGYESLTGYVLLYGAPGGTVVVAQLEGLPSGGFFALHLHQGESCRTIQEALTAPDPIGACGPAAPQSFGGFAGSFGHRKRLCLERSVYRTLFAKSSQGAYVIVTYCRGLPFITAGDAGERIGCGVIW